MTCTAWEQERDWATIRPFVYYQLENFVAGDLVAGRDVVDFSAGLGDLSEYVATLGPKSLTATAHHPEVERPERLPDDAAWVAGVGAQDITERLAPDSADLILARMVIQFPTMEHDTVDVDDILSQMSTVLRPGGTVVVSTHAYFDLPGGDTVADDLDGYLLETREEAARLVESDDPIVRRIGEDTLGRVDLVRYLGLPPREGPFGATGFGLKVPMLLQSFFRSGYRVDLVEDLEPFTYPYHLGDRSGDAINALGAEFMERKRQAFTSPEYQDAYRRPAVLRRVLEDLRSLTAVTCVPIVRVVATRPVEGFNEG